MSAVPAEGKPSTIVSPAVVLGGLTVLALLLRFGRLGHWGFDSDEIFMLRDSVLIRGHNPRPLLYLLNHFLARVLPLDEFGIRFLPAAFGTLSVPAFYFVARRLIGVRAALFGSLLVTVSALLVIYSQFGRYWSLVFMLCAVYPYALYLGVRERDRGMLMLGIVTAVLAALAHPTSVLLVGGPALWLLATWLRPSQLRVLWARPAVRWGALAVIVMLAIVAYRFVPVLHGWISSHDKNPGSGQFLLRKPVPLGLKQAFLLLAYVQGWSFSVVWAGLAGLYLLWRERDPVLAQYLACVAGFAIAFITLASLRTPVSTYYMVPAAPVFFLGAGYFLDRVFALDWRMRPRWLVPATVLGFMLLEGLPTLVSQYLNGRRYDFKTSATWLRPRLRPADVVFSDQPVVLAHYLAPRDIQRLRYDTGPLRASLDTVAGAPGAALWIVAPAPAHAFRTNLKQGGLAGWIYRNCQLRNTIGNGRVDFREQYLQVFRCPPEAADQPEARRASAAPFRSSTSR